jgi:uncharacterized protein YlxP (DUF503 family)
MIYNLGAPQAGFSVVCGNSQIVIRKSKGESMLIGVMKVQIYMHGITSLKDKRHIVKGVIGRLQSRFNVSISEVEHQDSKATAVFGIAVVSNDAVFIDQQLDSILDFMRNDGRFYLGPVEREVFS